MAKQEKFKAENLLKISDLSSADFKAITDLARKFDDDTKPKFSAPNGKVIALIFEKPSLRTKITFEVAAGALGAQPVFLSSEQILSSGGNQKGRESLPDIARNLERFCDMIVARVYRHETLQVIAEYIDKPVINALCDRHHPSQAIADIMAIEKFARPQNSRTRICYIGDGNNVATSLSQAAALQGYDFIIAAPAGYEMPSEEFEAAQKLKINPAQLIEQCRDPREAIQKADVVYTDTFVSMGQESEHSERLKVFEKYQVNKALFELAGPEAVFMHCLPAHRGEEVTDEVMDHQRSIVFEQAEFRLHVAKALLSRFLNVQ